MEERLTGKPDRAAEAFAAEIGKLHTEMREGFDRVDRRLDLQGLMLATNTKARARVERLEGGKAA